MSLAREGRSALVRFSTSEDSLVGGDPTAEKSLSKQDVAILFFKGIFPGLEEILFVNNVNISINYIRRSHGLSLVCAD